MPLLKCMGIKLLFDLELKVKDASRPDEVLFKAQPNSGDAALIQTTAYIGTRTAPEVQLGYQHCGGHQTALWPMLPYSCRSVIL